MKRENLQEKFLYIFKSELDNKIKILSLELDLEIDRKENLLVEYILHIQSEIVEDSISMNTETVYQFLRIAADKLWTVIKNFPLNREGKFDAESSIVVSDPLINSVDFEWDTKFTVGFTFVISYD